MPDFGRNVDRPLTPTREDVNVFFSSSGVINALLTKLLGTKLGDYRPLVIFFFIDAALRPQGDQSYNSITIWPSSRFQICCDCGFR